MRPTIFPRALGCLYPILFTSSILVSKAYIGVYARTDSNHPDEFGTYDPVLGSFIPTSLLGSAPGKCFKNVDQTSWIQASSSNVFNGAETDIAGKLTDALKALFPHAGTDVSAAKIPNPFVGLAPSTYIDTKETTLALGDGGEDGQEIPFQPLLVKARRVDVIIATDAVRHSCY